MCAAAATFVVAWGGYNLWSTRSEVPQQDPRAREALAGAQAAFAKIEVKPLSEVRGRDGLQAVLQSVKVDADQAQTPQADISGVVAAATDLIYHRFMQDDPRSYVDWRKNAGYVFAPREELLKKYGEAASYEAATGAPPRDDQSIEDIFVAIWQYVEQQTATTTKPARIATHPDGFAIRFGELDPAGPRRYPRPVGSLGTERWMSPRSGGYTMWFRPPCDVDDLLKRRVQVRSATFSSLVECRDATRYALTLRLIQDPQSTRWFVAAVSIYAAPHVDLKGLY